MAGKSEPGLVENRFLDRVCHDGGCSPGAGKSHGFFYRVEDCSSIFLVQLTRTTINPHADWQDGQSDGECIDRLCGLLDGHDRHRDVDFCRQTRDTDWIIDQKECRPRGVEAAPRHEHDLAADAGRLAHRECNR